MDKKDVVHIHNGLLVIKRNKTESFVVMWMSVIQSEVSQKEKNKYSILTYIYEI